MALPRPDDDPGAEADLPPISSLDLTYPDPNILEKHKDLIEGMTQWYSILVKLRGLMPDEVWYPPHKDPKIDVQGLKEEGYDDEVVAVIQHLPWLATDIAMPRGEEGAEIAPTTKAYNYFLQFGRQKGVPPRNYGGGWAIGSRNPYTDVGVRRYDIESWSFPLTYGSPMWSIPSGEILIYDTRTQAIHTLVPDDGIMVPDKPLWCETNRPPPTPAADLIRDKIRRLSALEWIPKRGSGVPCAIMQAPSLRTGQSQDFSERYHNAWNRILGHRMNYIRCGWPDACDANRFDAQVELYCKTIKNLDQMIEFWERVEPIILGLPNFSSEEKSAKLQRKFNELKRKMSKEGITIDAHDYKSFKNTSRKYRKMYSSFLEERAGDHSLRALTARSG